MIASDSIVAASPGARTSAVSIRRATPADREAAFAFIREAYRNRWQFKIPSRWEWQFVANPFARSGELPIWLAFDEQGTVVGQSCAMLEPMKLGQQTVTVGWGVDAYVDPRYRGQGIGRRLQAANCGAQELFMSISMAPVIRDMKTDLGAVTLGAVSTYLRAHPLDRQGARSALLTHIGTGDSTLKGAAGRLLAGTRLDVVAAELYNARRSWLDARGIAAAQRDVATVAVEAFDEEVDTLWESVSTHFDALIKRDHRYLNWKYVDQPHIRYQRHVARRAGRICGYIVLRLTAEPEPKMGIVADIFAAPDDAAAVAALLACAMRIFNEASIGTVVAATNVRPYQHALELFGFAKIREDVPVAGSRVNGALVERALASRWLLAKGDHDWDQYPLAAV